MSKKKKKTTQKVNKEDSPTSVARELFGKAHGLLKQRKHNQTMEELRKIDWKKIPAMKPWKEMSKAEQIANRKELIANHKEQEEGDRQEEALLLMYDKCNLAERLAIICMEESSDDEESKLYRRGEKLLELVYEIKACPEEVSNTEFAKFDFLCKTCGIMLENVEIKERKKTTDKKNATAETSEKKHKPWQEAPDGTGFILLQKTNARLYFCFDGENKDLCFRSNAHILSLMAKLSGGSMRSSEVEELLNPNSTASKLIRRANEALNGHIAKKGFIDVPENTEFIGYENGAYYSVFPILPINSLEDLDKAYNEIEQKFVKGKHQDDLNKDYLIGTEECNN